MLLFVPDDVDEDPGNRNIKRKIRKEISHAVAFRNMRKYHKPTTINATIRTTVKFFQKKLRIPPADSTASPMAFVAFP